MTHIDPIACAVFLLAAFGVAGFAQTAWFAAPASRALAVPLDFGITIAGRRLLGAHKTWRGFAIMVPATSVAFVLVASLMGSGHPATAGLWPLAPMGYAALGAWAGFGFMAGELPNSFVKRRLGVEAGRTASRWGPRACQFVADRVDSALGTMIALSLMVPTPWQTWALVLLLGPLLHWSFSATLSRFGLKGATRSAGC